MLDPAGGYLAVERSKELVRGALSLSRIRELVTVVANRRVSAGGRNLTLGHGLQLFGPGDVDDLYDQIHPTPAGYLRIAARFSEFALGSSGWWAKRMVAPVTYS